MSGLIFGASRAFRRLIETSDEYAKTPWPVLILGETGVGKELLARRIHEKSASHRAPFVAVNCGAIPPTLFESELFGYERGAFSGALQNYRGLIRSAQGGTLFLDEVGELDLLAQVKLLRWLDHGEVRSLGSLKSDRVHTRLVAATNVDLATAVAQGRFRLDLFERLNVLTLHVPPLRDRAEDIELIARGFFAQHAREFEEHALPVLKRFHWPGNVRQLRNVLLRAVARCQDRICDALLERLLEEERAFAQALLENQNPSLQDSSLADIEKRVIIDRIRKCHGNKKRAAEELGIAKSTLHEKIRRWNEASALDFDDGVGLGMVRQSS